MDMGEIYTLCGSTKFKKYFEVVARQLEISGYTVFYPGVFSKSDGLPKSIMIDDIIDNLKSSHMKKIDLCNCIYVINPDGYIGESTNEEIGYAIKAHKSVVYLETDDEMNQLFNSMTGITDAIEEMKKEEEEIKYFRNHPDVICDPCCDHDDDHHEISEDYSKETNRQVTKVLDISNWLITDIAIVLALLMIACTAYLRYRINELCDKMDQTIETMQDIHEDLQEIHENLHDINEQLDNMNEELGEVRDGLKDVKEELGGVNNELEIVDEEIADLHSEIVVLYAE